VKDHKKDLLDIKRGLDNFEEENTLHRQTVRNFEKEMDTVQINLKVLGEVSTF
jgi:hypothetical protein